MDEASRSVPGTRMATQTERSRIEGRAIDPRASAEPIDTTTRLITPERIAFEYPLAGPFRRLLAYVVDLTLWVALWIGSYVLASLLALGEEGTTRGIFLAAAFFLYWGYGAAFEALLNGRTPGKRALNLRVVSSSGAPITGGQAFLRHLVWAVEGLVPLGGLPALTSVVLTRRFQRLGDLAAGTMVVAEARPLPSRMPRIKDPDVLNLLPHLPRNVEVGSQVARALADYVKARGRFGRERRAEMAAPLARPLRERYGLSDGSSDDALLCAFYQRVFVEE
jgi:uncharacterized RDD family membrane protein YckC